MEKLNKPNMFGADKEVRDAIYRLIDKLNESIDKTQELQRQLEQHINT